MGKRACGEVAGRRAVDDADLRSDRHECFHAAMPMKAEAYFVTAGLIVLVTIAVWLWRRRGRIASTLGDASISAMDGTVRLTRKASTAASEAKAAVSDRVRQRLEEPPRSVSERAQDAVRKAPDDR